MTLAELEIGKTAIIRDVSGQRSFRRRLLELGLLPGTDVQVLRRAPLGDPVELFVRGTHLSIRTREARHITLDAKEP